MHVRRDDDQPQESIEITIHSDIGVFHLRIQRHALPNVALTLMLVLTNQESSAIASVQ